MASESRRGEVDGCWILEALSVGTLVIDSDHRIHYANPAFLTIFAVTADALVGRIVWECWDQERYQHIKESYEEAFRTRSTTTTEVESVEQGQTFEVVSVYSSGYLVVTVNEISRHRRALLQVQANLNATQAIMAELSDCNSLAMDSANTDMLTGLANRRRVGELAESVFPALLERKLPVSLILVDIDHFKTFNDTYGHIEGDNVLRKVGAAIAETALESETAARIGGEEFLLLCPTIGLKEATERAEKILEAIRSVTGTAAPVTASLGVASAASAEHPWMATLERADRAMYAAKSQGRNLVVAWSSAMDRTDDFRRSA